MTIKGIKFFFRAKPSISQLLVLFFAVCLLTTAFFAKQVESQAGMGPQNEAYQDYIDFFEQVYETMDEHYYQPVSRSRFDLFIHQFNDKIYSQLQQSGKSIDYIRWRSAAMLVDHLITAEDVFSAFYPPKPAREYQETALGKRIDLGISGEKVKNGYRVTHIEPRSDAYAKGLRMGDILLRIGQKKLRRLDEAAIADLLNPLADTTILLTYLEQGKLKKKMEVTSREYFKQTVFLVPVKAPGVFCLRIERFNKKTSEDLFRHLELVRQAQPLHGLIIDLRGNPGGPPLAAREIASFFLPPGDSFAYFQKRGQRKALLDVPRIPDQYHYHGPLVILIDEKSGSASELFSGVLQRKGRAVLMGTNSAGQVMLKSMYHFDDESMLLLITSRGYDAEGRPFSFDGLNPDRRIDDAGADVLEYAAMYFYYTKQK